MSDLMLTTIALHDDGNRCFADTCAHVKQFCETHKWQVGVAEMAIGAALIAIGLQSGALQMGADVVATKFGSSTAGLFGGTAGTFIGALPGLALGGIGVAAGGGAIAIPAVLLMGGGALILGLAGYGVGQLVGQFLLPVPGLAELVASASLAVVGVALFIDGARRLTKDPTVRRLAADFKGGVLRLARVESEAFIDSLEGLQRCFDEELRPFLEDLAKDPKSSAATAAMVAAGAVGGQAAAAASVTLLGSSSLGALGISLGLVSAPLWPVIAGGGVGLVLAYGAWKVVKQRGRRRMAPLMQLPALRGPAAALGLSYEKPDA